MAKKLPAGWTLTKEIIGHAYAKNGNTHNPTPRVMWHLHDATGRRVDKASLKRKLVEFYGVEAPAKKTKTPKQLDAEIATSLADRARTRGVDPESDEGPAAMLNSLTFADIRRVEADRARFPRLVVGAPVEYTVHNVGGSRQAQGTVGWDHGQSGVEIRVMRYGKPTTIRAKRSSSGRLEVYE